MQKEFNFQTRERVLILIFRFIHPAEDLNQGERGITTANYLFPAKSVLSLSPKCEEGVICTLIEIPNNSAPL